MDSKTAMGSEPHASQVRPDFERIALLLQGGGALGSYQGGVYQALAEADLHPHWVAGISIGAINASLIAGNPPQRRVERLREFWETVTEAPFGPPLLLSGDIKNDLIHQFINQGRAMSAMLWGAPSFFKPSTIQDLVEFCAPVAAEADPLPFYYYDIPGMTGVRLPMSAFLYEAKFRP